MDFITEQLNPNLHDRNAFDCGIAELNAFLKQYAHQNQTKNLSKTYVAAPTNEPQKIYGYYTLSAGHIHSEQLPESLKIKLPKYPIPVVRIARLAVDKNSQGQGIGSFLLYDAFSKMLSIAERIGLYAAVVDAKNESAKQFYKKYGFQKLQDSALTLFLSMATIHAAV